jgi:very-short-patch-repair endonuclease
MLPIASHSAELSIWSRADLLAVMSRRRLASAIATGEIVRLRRGVYADPALPADIQSAVRIGGVASCITSAAAHGLWLPPRGGLHVAVPRGASRLRGPSGRPLHLGRSGAALHWWPLHDDHTALSASLLDGLSHVVRCQSPRFAVAVIDSALHRGVIDDADVAELMSRVPAVRRLPMTWFDAHSESGIESLVRFDVQRAGLRCRTQVRIPEVGRVDVLVEDRVIVEVDGREWHKGEQVRDYRRDLLATRLGHFPVRVDYHHAVFEPALVVSAVQRACRWVQRHSRDGRNRIVY